MILKQYEWCLSKHWWLQSKEKYKILIVSDNIITNILSNKKHETLVTESVICGSKLSIVFVLIKQLYFIFPKMLH